MDPWESLFAGKRNITDYIEQMPVASEVGRNLFDQLSDLLDGIDDAITTDGNIAELIGQLPFPPPHDIDQDVAAEISQQFLGDHPHYLLLAWWLRYVEEQFTATFDVSAEFADSRVMYGLTAQGDNLAVYIHRPSDEPRHIESRTLHTPSGDFPIVIQDTYFALHASEQLPKASDRVETNEPVSPLEEQRRERVVVGPPIRPHGGQASCWVVVDSGSKGTAILTAGHVLFVNQFRQVVTERGLGTLVGRGPSGIDAGLFTHPEVAPPTGSIDLWTSHRVLPGDPLVLDSAARGFVHGKVDQVSRIDSWNSPAHQCTFLASASGEPGDSGALAYSGIFHPSTSYPATAVGIYVGITQCQDGKGRLTTFGDYQHLGQVCKAMNVRLFRGIEEL